MAYTLRSKNCPDILPTELKYDYFRSNEVHYKSALESTEKKKMLYK